MNSNQTIRAFFRAVKVENTQPPYDTLHLKVFYPARMSGSQLERDMGIVPADPALAPFPVVIFFAGVNCGAELYQWLGVELAQRGLVVITFNWVAENLPGIVGLTPGVDISKWTPTTYGTGPTASALPAILQELEQLQAGGILAGLLDLERVILGGHSAGGRVALESADSQYFPQLAAAFGYGVHTLGPVQMGYEPETILPLPQTLPLLLMGGTEDGVIAKSSFRYGIEAGDAMAPVVRTFEEAVIGGRQDCYLVLVKGANHFAIADSFDGTTGRPFLDFPATQPSEKLRALIADTVGLFVDAQVRQQANAAENLQRLSNSPLVHSFACK